MPQFSSNYTLKKGSFVAGSQCAKRMWLELHEKGAPELIPDAASRWLMDQGIAVGKLAQRYVAGGLAIARGGRSVASILSESWAAISDPRVNVIYEAGFISHDTLVYSDILERNPTGFTLIEVKSTTHVNEDEHIPDLAIQTHVLRGAGVRVTRCELMYLNRECRYPDLADLFKRADVTELVEDRLLSIPYELDSLKAVAASKTVPNVQVGPHCTSPRDCAFMDRCWPEVPDDHVTNLYMIQKKKAAQFAEAGWIKIQDLPDDLKLSAIAARQRRSLRAGTMIVEKNSLLASLQNLNKPIAHIDFETVAPAIPVWNGCRPYDNVPVQLSCHFVDSFGNIRHHEWLTSDDRDPRPAIGHALIDACEGARTVTAYYSKFEQTCIRLIADVCPEIAPRLLEIADNIVDLLPIVREHVYHPEFRGSFSIKSVLPVLVPGMSYAELPISEGGTASATLMRMMFRSEEFDELEREKLRENLLQYCKRDTEAMVALTERLTQLASS
jgi:hypothetical protein